MLTQMPIAAMNSTELTPARSSSGWRARIQPSRQTTEGHRNGDVRRRYGPKRPFFAAENAGVEMQAGYQAENQHGDKRQPGKRRQHLRDRQTSENNRGRSCRKPKGPSAMPTMIWTTTSGISALQSRYAQQHHRNRDNNKRLQKKDRARGHQVWNPPVALRTRHVW